MSSEEGRMSLEERRMLTNLLAFLKGEFESTM